MIHPRITLVSTEALATLRGVSREDVYEWADGGPESHQWVFNISLAPERNRDLRFWSREINEPAATRGLTLEQVITQIVPRRDRLPGQFCGLRNYEVGDLLRVGNNQLLRLRAELRTTQHDGGIWVPRAALEEFFRRRWCYAATALRATTPKISVKSKI